MRYNELIERETPGMPQKFWMVFHMTTGNVERDSDILQQIADGRLTGIQGVSDNRQIMLQFFGSRNAVLIMDPAKVVAMNTLLKIDYTNPDGLSANNMQILYRLLNKRPERDQSQLMQQIFMEMIKYFPPQLSYMFKYYGMESSVGYRYGDSPFPINSLEELATATHDLCLDVVKERIAERNFGYSLEDLEDAKFNTKTCYNAAKKAVMHLGSLYQDEGEWLVQSKTFKVPINSTVLIRIDMRARALYDEWKEAGAPQTVKFYPLLYELNEIDKLIENIKNFELSARYNIRFVDAHKWNLIAPKVSARISTKKHEQGSTIMS